MIWQYYRNLLCFSKWRGNSDRKKACACFVYTAHGDIERQADGLTFSQVEAALINGEILEQYPDTGRGKSCLVLGYAGENPIHIVCGWRGDRVAIITVYLPSLPNFIDPRTRG